MAAVAICRTWGGKSKLEQFLPYREKIKPKTADELWHKLESMFPNGHGRHVPDSE